MSTTEPRIRGLEEPDIPEGSQVGEYVVEEKLGEGGFGRVYRARHPLIGKLAAIKVLSRKYSADPDIVSRFIAEARAVNQIRHRNIVDIFSFGQLEDGRSYFVMELLEGTPLDAYIRETGGLPLSEALPILRAIARALDAAHAKNIAHRDLKPENIILVRDDDADLHPKLLDFGIAKLVGENAGFSTKHKTRTGTPIGTPIYMSPEQARGDVVDHRTDIYSFGCVAYELLTGKVPFDGDNHLAIMLKQVSEEAIPPSVRASENPVLLPLPTEIDATIAWLMRKDATQRPSSLIEAINALEAAAGMPPTRHTPVPRATPLPGALPRAISGSETTLSLAPGASASPSSERISAGLAQTVAPTTASIPAAAIAPKRSKLPLVVGGVVLAAGAAIAIVMAGGGTEPAPVVAGSASSVAPAPVVPKLATLTIEGAPPNTEVFGPKGPLGRVPGKIQMLHEDVEYQLTLKADGYRTHTIIYRPIADLTMQVALELEPVAEPAIDPDPPPPPPGGVKPTKPTIAKKPRPTGTPKVKPPTKPEPKDKPPAPNPWTRN